VYYVRFHDLMWRFGHVGGKISGKHRRLGPGCRQSVTMISQIQGYIRHFRVFSDISVESGFHLCKAIFFLV
jgi:hypothetical protein